MSPAQINPQYRFLPTKIPAHTSFAYSNYEGSVTRSESMNPRNGYLMENQLYYIEELKLDFQGLMSAADERVQNETAGSKQLFFQNSLSIEIYLAASSNKGSKFHFFAFFEQAQIIFIISTVVI